MVIPIAECSIEQILLGILYAIIQVQIMHEHTALSRFTFFFPVQNRSVTQMKDFFIIPGKTIKIARTDPIGSTELRFLMIDLSGNPMFSP